MRYHILGNSGLRISALGFGCMGMTPVYGPVDEAEACRALRRYLDLGGNFLDTAERYGPFNNEVQLGRFLRDVPRESVVVATKFGFRINRDTGQSEGLDSSPANVVKVCDESLRRLQIDVIDLYYQHRVDPQYPIEETVGAMAALVKAGKVRGLGLSEASSSTLRRASAVHPIAALQSEYSLWTRDPEADGTLTACEELNATFVAYSPLGRGFLTGAINTPSDLAPTDWRRSTPRFQPAAMVQNVALITELEKMARNKGCTAAQLALAWLMARPGNVIPIPGTKQKRRVEENMAAVNLTLTAVEVERLCTVFPIGVAAGARYPASGMATLDGRGT